MPAHCDLCGAPAYLLVQFRAGGPWWPYCREHERASLHWRRRWKPWQIADVRLANPTDVG